MFVQRAGQAHAWIPRCDSASDLGKCVLAHRRRHLDGHRQEGARHQRLHGRTAGTNCPSWDRGGRGQRNLPRVGRIRVLGRVRDSVHDQVRDFLFPANARMLKEPAVAARTEDEDV